MSKVLQALFAVLALCASYAAAGIAGYWLFLDDTAPLVVTNPAPVDLGAYAPGAWMEVPRSFCMSREATGVVIRTIVDGVIYQMPTLATSLSAGCFESRSYLVQVPESLAAGRYIYRVKMVYRTNPVHDVEVQLPDVHFEIVR